MFGLCAMPGPSTTTAPSTLSRSIATSIASATVCPHAERPPFDWTESNAIPTFPIQSQAAAIRVDSSTRCSAYTIHVAGNRRANDSSRRGGVTCLLATMAAADHEGVWAPEVRAAFKDWVEASIGFSPDTAAAIVEELEAVLQVSWSVSV